MLSGAAIASPVAAAIVAATFPPVSVSVAPGLACPPADAIERAIASVREGDPGAAGPAYRLRVAAAGDAIRADLTTPDGVAVWTRTLPAGPAACTSGAEALALIVERELRQLAWTPPPAAQPAPARPAAPPSPIAAPPPPAPAATDPRAPPTAVATAPVAGARPPAAGPAAPVLPSHGPRLTASVGPALWSRAGTPGIAVEGRVRLGGLWQAGLGALVPPASSSITLYTAADGSEPQAKVTAAPFLMTFGVERPVTRALALGASAEGLLTVERGESVGIAVPRTAWRGVLTAGVAAGGALALGERVRLGLRAGAYRTLLGRSFTVDGVGGDLLEPPAWQALVRLGLEWVFVP
jgi:hypothetical protein